MSLLSRFQDFQDLRTPRTQVDAGIDWLEWDRIKPLRPIWWDVLAAIGVTLFLASAYWLASVI